MGINSSDDPSVTRTPFVMLMLLAMIGCSTWSVYHYQFEKLPVPLSAEVAGKEGFSEKEAMKHVKALVEFGPHPVGSHALDHAVEYVRVAAEMIKNASDEEVEVEVEEFHAKPGARVDIGSFKGKSFAYADLKHIILRISPKYLSEVKDNSILVSSHIDTVFTTGGAGDCSSCIAVMLELARAASHWAHNFKTSVIFLFNIGEEEGLNGAHSFITQHQWSESIRVVVDLEAMGVGGKSSIFQAGPDPWAIEMFARVAKYPLGNVMSQDLFASGIINSATDFQIYQQFAGLSGLDFVYLDNTAAYHTKNDKLEFLKEGSFQHLGENMLAFLRHGATSRLEKNSSVGGQVTPDHDLPIYFDILGSYMIVYRWGFAKMLHNTVIVASLLIWIVSLAMGGYTAAISFVLSCLSIIFMWILSLSLSLLVAFILPNMSSSAVPYFTRPWLVIGLFGCPSLLGALAGQHLGFRFLQKNLSHKYAKRNQTLSPSHQAELAKLEAEHWLFKSGTFQWLVILMIANCFNAGSTYIALIWFVTPTFSYALLEATISPPKPLSIATLVIAISAPIVVTSGSIIRMIGVLIGMTVRWDSNPGNSSEWLVNVIMAVALTAIVCSMLVFVLSYVHLSGAKGSLILVICVLFGLSLALVQCGFIPAFTEDVSRAVNAVRVVDSKDGDITSSYISMFSATPGKLTREIDHMNVAGFECGRDKVVDFVTFSVKYGCWTTSNETDDGWTHLDIPTLHFGSVRKTQEERVTDVSIDSKVSRRWSVAINTRQIADFILRVSGESEELVPMGNKPSVDGWHLIQFSGGQNAPTKFNLTLVWSKKSTQDNEKYLLKLRSDVDRLTPKTQMVLAKFPYWSTPFGKSFFPRTLAFLVAHQVPLDV